MREINIEGCQVIGTGAFGKVYRIDADTVVKVYDNPSNLPLIETEQERSRRAFIKGIPTAIPFGIAKVGDTYGSIFELIDARNCSDFLISHPEKFDSIVSEYADFIMRFNAVQSEPGEFPDAREVYVNYLEDIRDKLPEKIYTSLLDLVRSIPESRGLVHGDIQVKNIMLSNKEMFLIDMNTISAGSNLFEFAGLYRTYIAFNDFDPGNSDRFLGISENIARKIYYRTSELCGVEANSRDIQLLGLLSFLHVVIIEISLPDSFMVRLAVDKLRQLLISAI